mmetsp:Transcript_28786/g.53981  ORF Transcript_28786/g.53981 Transcript_28786/m.53981 type:complete len:1236 (-) Transcript_28786:77-3784(-)
MAPGRGDQDAKKASEDGRKISSPLPFLLLLLLAGFIIADKCGLFAQAPVIEQPRGGHQFETAAAGQHHPALKSYASDAAGQVPATQTPKVSEQLHSRSASSLVSPSNGSVEDASPPRRASGGGENGAQHNAMLFLFNAIILGTMVSHALSFDFFHHLEYSHTVVLYLLGLVYSLVLEGMHADEELGVLGRSYNMWMQIDPQLLLFTMLPALLTGQTMNIDTDVVKRCANQCVCLAGPGVVINGFLTALGLHLYLGWSFILSLTTGAILCATDPVAVVALLKDLNASPALIVQIQGESLLNNGTAMVFYTICYNLLKGEPYDFGGIVKATVWKVICAWGMGSAIGYLFNLWIRASNNKLEHTSGLVQISLTISSAYGTFYLAEGLLGMSGVIATVGCAHVLAKKTWIVMVSRESVKTVWEMLEFFGNTLVFFLAGALTGKTMLHIPWGDYLHLLVLYIMLNIIRAFMILISRPVLKMLSSEHVAIPFGNAIVISWSGVRGAVSLTLGMQVLMDRAGGALDDMDAYRVLFFVSGIALLTITVNAQTCCKLVRWFGIANVPIAKLRMLEILLHRMEEMMVPKNDTKCDSIKSQSRISMMEALKGRVSLLEERDRQAEEAAHRGETSSWRHHAKEAPKPKLQRESSNSLRRTTTNFFESQAEEILSTEDLIEAVERHQERHAKLPESILGDLPKPADMPFASDHKNLKQILTIATPDIRMMRAMHEAFLNLLRRRYWLMIEAGDVVPGTNEAEVLLGSTRLAMISAACKLGDFSFIRPYCERSHLPPQFQRTSEMPATAKDLPRISDNSGDSAAKELAKDESFQELLPQEGSRAKKIMESSRFDSVMMLVIFVNAILMAIEEAQDNSGSKSQSGSSLGWLIVDIVFTCAFTVEFGLKLWVLRLSYFYTAWNVFDAILVLMGWVGTILQFLALESPGGNVTREGRLFSVARSFRVLRVLRIFRLLFFFSVLKAKLAGNNINLTIAEHMQKVTILKCVVKAHLIVQKEIAKFFGTAGRPDSFEVVYTIMQSQCTVYEAMMMALEEEQQLGGQLALEVKSVQVSKAMAERLEAFIHHAHEQGMLNASEAESILSPLREHMQAWTNRLRANHFGWHRSDSETAPTEEEVADHQRVVQENIMCLSPFERQNSGDDSACLSKASDSSDKAKQDVLQLGPCRNDDVEVLDLKVDAEPQAARQRLESPKAAWDSKQVDARTGGKGQLAAASAEVVDTCLITELESVE